MRDRTHSTQMQDVNGNTGRPPEFLTIEQAANLLQIGRSAAYEMASRGDLPAIRLGPRLLRVPRSALYGLVAQTAKLSNVDNGEIASSDPADAQVK